MHSMLHYTATLGIMTTTTLHYSVSSLLLSRLIELALAEAQRGALSEGGVEPEDAERLALGQRHDHLDVAHQPRRRALDALEAQLVHPASALKAPPGPRRATPRRACTRLAVVVHLVRAPRRRVPRRAGSAIATRGLRRLHAHQLDAHVDGGVGRGHWRQRRREHGRPSAHERGLGVADVPVLRRDRHALAVARAPLAVQPRALRAARALAAPDEVHAQHHAGAALSRLTVDRDHVRRVLGEVRIDGAAEGRDECQWARAVVVGPVSLAGGRAQTKQRRAVGARGLGAQVVNLALMAFPREPREERTHLRCRVAIAGLDADRWEAHRYQAVHERADRATACEGRRHRRRRCREPSKFGQRRGSNNHGGVRDASGPLLLATFAVFEFEFSG
eukprot:scaffold45520_cov64-Phaeocystis_antarctica.AAC.3